MKKVKPITKAVLKLALPLLISILAITQAVCTGMAINAEETFVALGFGQATLSTGVIASFSWAYRIYLIKNIKKESQNGKQGNI
jgi:hypothetical protein